MPASAPCSKSAASRSSTCGCIDEQGVVAPIRRLIERVQEADGHLHLSLDVDAMDPQLAPAVGTTVPGGLTYREAHLVMEMLHDAGIVGSMDIVELNPFLDHAGKSATAARRSGREPLRPAHHEPEGLT